MAVQTDFEGLGSKLLGVLGRFHNRVLDDALMVEMTEVLNEELAPWRNARRIRLARNESRVWVHLEPDDEPGVFDQTCPEAEVGDEWRLRVRDAEASV